MNLQIAKSHHYPAWIYVRCSPHFCVQFGNLAVSIRFSLFSVCWKPCQISIFKDGYLKPTAFDSVWTREFGIEEIPAWSSLFRQNFCVFPKSRFEDGGSRGGYRWKLLSCPIFELELCSLRQKLRFESPEWKIKWWHSKSKRKNWKFRVFRYMYVPKYQK